MDANAASAFATIAEQGLRNKQTQWLTYGTETHTHTYRHTNTGNALTSLGMACNSQI